MDFFSKRKWFKGNIHTHSTQSDGRKTRKEVISWYRRCYDFVAITDHDVYYEGFRHDDFLVLPGIEMYHHTLGIGLVENPMEEKKDKDDVLTLIPGEWPLVDDPKKQQAEIDLIQQYKGISVVGHPFWHGLTIEYLISMDNYDGIEIYNSASDYRDSRGYSTVHWDYLLTHGKRVNGFATDDSHWIENLDSAGKGWICVNCDELSSEQIMNAIKHGNFYSTQGPQIFQISLNDKIVSVHSSPCKRINFVADLAGRSKVFINKKGLLESAQYEIPDYLKYVRIEIIDSQGLHAWSNPIYFI